ncbi:hypothetical protein [Methylobacterium brachiatum]|uniref:hypothetical protein n=1 Tax=Methylobacterium brachiatum TaxID=269660 RepID=UPI0008E58584|nr:hypothetical protein [Methylobacterium brachiatum]SFJ72099.1 hypothetical protein SAMN02799642_05292 [Methylobacterium brachiatum]
MAPIDIETPLSVDKVLNAAEGIGGDHRALADNRLVDDMTPYSLAVFPGHNQGLSQPQTGAHIVYRSLTGMGYITVFNGSSDRMAEIWNPTSEETLAERAEVGA